MGMTRYILSIDGGGVRGIIPAMVLAEIERRIERPLTDIFYMMAGSESGGLTLAGINHKRYPRNYSADHMVTLYKQHGPLIFADRDKDRTGAEYYDDYLNRVLDDRLEDENFSQSRRKIVITGYDIYNNQSFMLHSWNNDSRIIKVKDAVRATLAVPTHFLPKDIETYEVDGTIFPNKLFATGSLVTNNPAGYGYACARRWWPNDKCVVLSLGTGRTHMQITSHDAKKLTKKDWLRPFRQIMFSSDNGINNLLSTMLQSNFIRIERSAYSSASETDNASEENIWALQQEAFNTISEHEVVIDKFCKSVSEYVGDDP